MHEDPQTLYISNASRGKADDAPSKWGELLGANVEDIGRFELQWAAGAGTYRTFGDWNAKPVEVQVVTGGDRFVFELDNGHLGAREVADMLWAESRSKFDDENVKRDGTLRELRFKLVAYAKDGQVVAESAAKMRPADESVGARGVVDAFDVPDTAGPNDYTTASIVREYRASHRELVGSVHSLVARIENMAGNMSGLVQGVVQQAAQSIAMQQRVVDHERELVDEERTAAISTAALDRGFDLLERYAGAFFASKGLDPQTFGPAGGGSATPLLDTAAAIVARVSDDAWSALESINAPGAGECFADLRAALVLDDEHAMRAALMVTLPPVRAFGPQALPLIPADVLALLERLRRLVFPAE